MDLISRQAAIDMLSLDKEMLNRVLDDTYVVGTDREKYSWGLGLIESNIKDIEELPSAEPEITRCKDCRCGREACGNIECFVDSNIPPEYHGYEWFFPKRRKEVSVGDGMSDLIDRNIVNQALTEYIEGLHECTDNIVPASLLMGVQGIIRTTPNAEKTGKWMKKPDPYGFFDEIPVCSECGRTTKMREKYNYCPHCGARMEADE